MKVFCYQLKLILWKNVLLRKRSKVRLAIELLWPLVLFLILSWVRTRETGDMQDDCHTVPKAMPSVGGVEFIQNFFCSFQNECYKPYVEEWVDPWPDAEIHRYRNISDLLNNLTGSTESLKEVRRIIFPSRFSNMSTSSENETNGGSKLIRHPKLIVDYRFADISVVPQINWRQFAAPPGFDTDRWVKFLCGSKKETHDPTKGGPAGQPVAEKLDDFGEGLYIPDPEASEDCNFMFEQISKNKLTYLGWKIIKPMLRGVLLFSPDNDVTRDIMQRTEDKFRQLQQTERNVNLSLVVINRTKSYMENNPDDIDRLNTTLGNPVLVEALLDALNITEPDKRIYAKAFIEYARKQNVADMITNLTTIQSVLVPAQMFLSCIRYDKIIGFPSETAAVDAAVKYIDEERLWSVVHFENTSGHLKFKIRMDSDKVHSTVLLEEVYINRREPPTGPSTYLKYLTYGFSFLQEMVERSIIEKKIMDAVPIEGIVAMFLQQYPYPCYVYDRFIRAVTGAYPLFMILSWIFAAAMTIKSIVYEKEIHLKELMKVMGMGNLVMWLGWFIDGFIVFSVSATFLTIILKFGKITQHTEFTLLWVFNLSFAVSVICLCFLLSTFFQRANSSAAAGGVIFFLLYLPYNYVRHRFLLLEPWQVLLFCLLSNVSFGLGCFELAVMERDGLGVSWATLSTDYKHFTLTTFIAMMWIDSVIYFLLACYIEAVAPDPNMETPPEGLTVGVRVRGLSKIYSNGRVALKDLNVDFYENQITSFLGHNGAGKTTTMSILIGLFPPSSGTAWVNGHDITRDMKGAREYLGICPQHNILYGKLTVAEHIKFFSGLKGKKFSVTKERLNQILEDLGMPEKRNEFPAKLSGGMKRKLCIALAFANGATTVFLDEPTAGVDPHSRRSIWELLLKYKVGRTLVLSTHFMDEADILGDRIAIISRGTLKACGSSLFLKTRFGQGYSLHLVKAMKGTVARDSGDSNPQQEKKGSAEKPDDKRQSKKSLTEKDAKRASKKSLTEKPDAKRPSKKGSTVGDTGALSKKGSGMAIGTRLSKKSSTLIETKKLSKKRSTIPDASRLGKKSATTVTVSGFVKNIIPTATLRSYIGSEISFILPHDTTPNFQKLFQQLDDNLKALGVTSYGISDTTLEDVFLKITVEDLERVDSDTNVVSWYSKFCCCRRKNKPLAQVSPQNSQLTNFSKDISIKTLTPGQKSTSTRTLVRSTSMENLAEGAKIEKPENIPSTPFVLLWIMQMKAIFIKRSRNASRSLKSIFFEVVLPIVFICCTLLFVTTLPAPTEREDSARMTPHIYNMLQLVSFFADESNETEISANPVIPYGTEYFQRLIEDGILGPQTTGTECLRDFLKKKQCFPKKFSKKEVEEFSDSRKNISDEETQLPECICALAGGGQVCPGDAIFPPYLQIQNSFYWMDATKFNHTEWLLKTYFDLYISRVAGYTFEIRPPYPYNVTHTVRVLDALTMTLFDEDITPVPLPIWIPKPYNSIRLWFMPRATHSPVAYQNAMHNLLLRDLLPGGSPKDETGITLYQHPLPLNEKQLAERISSNQAPLGVVVAICMILALSFVPASFTLYLIEEVSSGAKHLHLAAGVKPIIYWAGNYLYDMFKYLLPVILCILLFVAFEVEQYVSKHSIGAFTCLLILYGWSVTPLMYPATFIFAVPSTAFVVLACTNLFLGVITTVSEFVLTTLGELGDQELLNIAIILRQVYPIVFPQYCLGRGLVTLTNLHINTVVQRALELDAVEPDRFEWDHMGKLLCILFIQGLLFFLVVIIFDYRSWIYIKICRPKPNFGKESYDDDDEDVARERTRVMENKYDPNSILVARRLTKFYVGKKLPSVNGICFAMDQGECFGLLGINGAGKTSTFKMLTGDVRISGGSAMISGFDVVIHRDQARKHFGYCPQEDGLDELLNSYEVLQLYGNLRGLRGKTGKDAATNLIDGLGLTRYAKRRCGTYSGGNKRKLSTAVALIGDPDIVFLDEPTSGMDPGARRQLWQVILYLLQIQKSVVLTTHSMEECEALCTRLGIMVNGRFVCLGSIQHLKNRFGSGYMLTIRCVRGKQDKLKSFIAKKLPSAVLDDEHSTQLKFRIPREEAKLSAIFQVMLQVRDEGIIEDYSLTQTSLDDIFVKFAKHQTDEI